MPYIVCILLLACSSGKSGKSVSDKGGNGAEAGGGSGGEKVNTGEGGGSSIAIGLGGVGTETGGRTQITAEQSKDGLLEITASEAKAILEDPKTACAGWVGESEAEASVVEFMIDVSGSMLKTTSSTGTLSKWTVTQNALRNSINELPSSLPVGMTFFPNMRLNASDQVRPVTACVESSDDVPIATLADAHRKLLVSTVDNMRANSQGATPTHDAYTIALAALKANTDPGQKYIVLITDGQPTQSLGCVGTGMTCTPEPPEPVISAISAANKDDKIKTFLVGSPGSEKNDCTNADVRDWLSAAARAGGTDTADCRDQGPKYCHFDLSQASDFAVALSGALGTISRSVVSCDYSVPPPPDKETIDKNLVNMIYNDGAGKYSLVLPSGASTCEKGWHFTDSTMSQIHVCTQTCALLQKNPMASVSLLFGCAQDQIAPDIQ
jgi:hypothetical protein